MWNKIFNRTDSNKNNDEPPIESVVDSNDFDFDFDEFDDDPQKSVIHNNASIINEEEAKKRAIAQAYFLAEIEAEKKEIANRLYRELRIVIETIKEYCEENDRMDWYEYILPTFTTLNKYGNRQNTEIMHALGHFITDITYDHKDDLHQVMPSKHSFYIKMFSNFIFEIAAGRL
jgi:hypothetical protein